MNNSIEVKSLTKNYPQFTLKNVSFDIPAGYITGFIGPNGSGKTTTIKSILNMIQPQSGSIDVLGKAIAQHPETMESVGIVLDNPLLVQDWTLLDVEQALAPFYRQWDTGIFQQLLERFKLNTAYKVKDLSRGMKVKLMIAIALSHHAQILILDEPTSGLDPVAREEIGELLQDFVKDEIHSVLFSTHITSDLEAIADFIVFILDGTIVYSGTKDALLDSYVLIKGDLETLETLDHSSLIGVRTHATGFEAMTAKTAPEALPASLLIERVNLEQIILFFNREAH